MQDFQVLMSFSFPPIYNHSYTLIFVTVLLYERCYLTCLASLGIKEGSNKKIGS